MRRTTRDHGGSVRRAREHGRRRSVRAGQKRMSTWEQEESGINISARGAWGQPEGTGAANIG